MTTPETFAEIAEAQADAIGELIATLRSERDVAVARVEELESRVANQASIIRTERDAALASLARAGKAEARVKELEAFRDNTPVFYDVVEAAEAEAAVLRAALERIATEDFDGFRAFARAALAKQGAA